MSTEDPLASLFWEYDRLHPGSRVAYSGMRTGAPNARCSHSSWAPYIATTLCLLALVAWEIRSGLRSAIQDPFLPNEGFIGAVTDYLTFNDLKPFAAYECDSITLEMKKPHLEYHLEIGSAHRLAIKYTNKCTQYRDWRISIPLSSLKHGTGSTISSVLTMPAIPCGHPNVSSSNITLI
jgi:hypothetical protein